MPFLRFANSSIKSPIYAINKLLIFPYFLHKLGNSTLIEEVHVLIALFFHISL
jgi:hypothetical protein